MAVTALVFGVQRAPAIFDQAPIIVAISKSRPRPPVEVMLVPKLIPAPVFREAPPQFVIAPEPAPIAGPIAAAPPPSAAPRPAGRVDAAFLALIQAHLTRYNTYPPDAVIHRIEGTVYLHFIMDAKGRVLFSEIAKSSGSTVLDAQVLALIQKAQPMPPIPAYLNADHVNLLVPVTFKLSHQ